MNILLLTYQGNLAGSTNSISFLANGLSNKGHTVVVGLRKGSLLHELLEPTNVILEFMHFGGRFDRKNIREIKDVVLKYDIQIINAQSSKDRYTSIFAKWRYKLRVKIYHTRRQPPKSIGGLQNYFYVKGTDKFITVSNGLKEIFVKKGIPASHVEVIYNGIPEDRYQQWDQEIVNELKQKYGLDQGQFIIGCVSRLKSQEQIIQALEILNDPSLVVIFVGIEEEQLKRKINADKLKNRIIFAGKVPPKEVLNYTRLFSVQILASITDGFGLVLLEAMAMKCPVIATNYGGIQDVVEHEYNGLLFENGNIAQLASHIQKMKIEGTRTKFIENGMKTALEKFSIEKTIDNYEAFFLNELENITSD